MSATQLTPTSDSSTTLPPHPRPLTQTASNVTNTITNNIPTVDTTFADKHITLPNLPAIHQQLADSLTPYITQLRTTLTQYVNRASTQSTQTAETVEKTAVTQYKQTEQLKSTLLHQIQNIRADQQKSLQTIAVATLGTAALSIPFGRRFVVQNGVLAGMAASFVINPYKTSEIIKQGIISADATIHNYAHRLTQQQTHQSAIAQQFLPCGCPIGADHVPHSVFGNLSDKQEVADVVEYLKQK